MAFEGAADAAACASSIGRMPSSRCLPAAVAAIRPSSRVSQPSPIEALDGAKVEQLLQRPAAQRFETRDVDALAQAQAHHQQLFDPLGGTRTVRVRSPVPVRCARSSQTFGSRHASVAMRTPPSSSRPWAPGPMPSHSPLRQ